MIGKVNLKVFKISLVNSSISEIGRGINYFSSIVIYYCCYLEYCYNLYFKYNLGDQNLLFCWSFLVGLIRYSNQVNNSSKSSCCYKVDSYCCRPRAIIIIVLGDLTNIEIIEG